MKFLLLLFLSLPAFSFNDWRIECQGIGDDGKLITVSDARINGDRNNRMVEFTQWLSKNSIEWSLGGRQYVENRNFRIGFFFNEGKRIDYKLSYLIGFSKLPSEQSVDLDQPNSLLELNFHSGLSSSSSIVKMEQIDLSCFYRRGGE